MSKFPRQFRRALRCPDLESGGISSSRSISRLVTGWIRDEGRGSSARPRALKSDSLKFWDAIAE